MRFTFLCIIIGILTTALSVDLKCEFAENASNGWTLGGFYGCTETLPSITARNTAVTLSPPTHKSSKSNSDVTALKVEHQKQVEYFPQKIENYFPNLEAIKFFDCSLKEIHQSDLKPFVKLKEIWFQRNSIEYLERGMFKYNPGLEYIDFDENKISYINPTIFDGLKNLKDMQMASNLCINSREDNPKAVLDLIDKIKIKCSDPSTLKNLDVLKNELLYEFIEIREIKGEIKKFETRLDLIQNYFRDNERDDSTTDALAHYSKVSAFVIIPILILLLMIVSIFLLIAYSIRMRKNQKDEEEEICEPNSNVEANGGPNDELYEEIELR